jgi:serine protease Do
MPNIILALFVNTQKGAAVKRYSYYLLAVIFTFTLSISACTRQKAEPKGHEIAQENPAPSKKPIMSDRDFRNAVINVAKTNIPAVVHIEVTQRQEIENPLAPYSPFESDPFFRHFFNIPQMPKKFKREMKGIGTGMIINDQGYILTNYHVVTGATEIQVILSNESQYKAKVIGTDPKTDLAVVKVSANEKLPYVIFGDSDRVEVGEWVVAIGHPRGLDQTVTQGIISAKHRQGIMEPSTYQDFLQTDAAINPGNSGGPLLDLDGRVIGVNAVIASQSGGFEGIGFAIPSNMAIHIAKSLISSGKVERGWLGITLQDIPFEKMKSLKLTSPKGAYVIEVMKGSPAYKAGLKPGDVILSYDGKQLEDSGELRNLVAGTPIGKEISLGIMRNGKRLTIPVKIGNPQEAARIMASVLEDKLGVSVRPITESEASKYGLEQGMGVLITKLDPKGPMASAGFETGDLVIQADDQPVGSPEELSSIVDAAQSGKAINILAMDHRTGRAGYIRVKVR